MFTPKTATQRILDEVDEERKLQDEKWGQQDHPSLDPVLSHRQSGCTPERMARHYEIPSEARAKFCNEVHFKHGTGTFAGIAVEELCEAVACMNDEELMRQELVQLAAVCVAWIEAIDRRAKKAADVCDI